MSRFFFLVLPLLVMPMAACSDEPTTPAPANIRYAGTLSLEVVSAAEVAIDVAKDGTIDVSLTGSGREAEGFFDTKAPLVAKGRLERFPENGSELYTAKLGAPARPSGPCKDAPVSLALSLHRRGQNARVGGSLTAYCGADVFHGVPAKVLRLAGDLPLR